MPAKATLTPFANFILMAEMPATAVVGAIIIPEAHQTKLNQGKVVDRGPLVSEAVVDGDILFFPLHSEHRLTWKGNKFILIAEDQVLGAIREIPETEAPTDAK